MKLARQMGDMGVAHGYSKRQLVAAWDAGKTTVTEATILQFLTLWFNKFIPLAAQAESESVGARKEAIRISRLVQAGWYLPIAGSEKAAAMMCDFLKRADCWGVPDR